MPQAIVLTDDKLAKSDESSIGLEPEVAAVVGPKKSSVFDFIYQRSTYYWSTIFINFCQVGLCTAGFALAIAHNEVSFKGNKKGYSGDIFVATGIYSVILFMFSVPTLYYHYKKGSDTGPKAFNAGRHFGTTICAVMVNLVNLYMLLGLGPFFRSKVEPCTDSIRPVLYHTMIGFVVLGALSNMAAARITLKSAKHAHGTEMVIDPNYRVPAWTLATTEESQGLSGGAIQL
ncbi:hypothetical protein CPB84DRAFT_1853676 [Gymnopilus junonius]|uniref:Uncharacterized protein n=1 Tax=Gymnopilus junonius TaxID=109634 RepID=A0A9P5NBQ5_GYMJU|nr:hypothetical protein CPB84DRAFT_1853676 [Gymnopilus junonius]